VNFTSQGRELLARGKLFVVILAQTLFAMRPSELPGTEIMEAELALERSKNLVQTQTIASDIYENKGWTAPSLEEQLNQDETLTGVMGEGAIFVPRFTESRLEPEYVAIKIDTLSKKEYTGKEWTGRHGTRLVVPVGSYMIIIGSGNMDKKFEYMVEVEEGKTTLIPPDWGGVVINTINENGEFVSESYEVFAVHNGESYGKGFGVTQERLNDVRTWILQPQVYRITRSGENASSISNYITVQVNPGELSYVELVFEESTGRLIAGGVQKMRLGNSRDSYWTYGMRLGGSASYTTLVTANGQKNDVWNAFGDLRFRTLYNRYKVFWLTELYVRENMQWLNEEQKESQWSIAQDMLQFQSSIVYRFFEWIGPYTRVNAKTHIFPEYYRGEDEKILISPSFDPLRFGEGVGLNLHSMISSSFDISAQTGFAARQTIRKNILVPVDRGKIVFVPANENIYDYGWENSLNIRLSLMRFVTMDLVGEVFFPYAKIKNYIVEELSADLRIALTRFLELSYQQQLIDRIAAGFEEANDERFESLNTIQLRLYVNF
jgi:ribosomal protein L21E